MSGFKKYMRGFTLAELLVVVSIISLLAVVSLGYIGGQLARGRDARRRAELEQIRSALEMYRADNLDVGYPIAATYRVDLTGGGYMRVVPEDSRAPSFFYNYTRPANVQYTLGAFLERGNPICTGGGGTCCPVGYSCGGQDCNYCVFDP